MPATTVRPRAHWPCRLLLTAVSLLLVTLLAGLVDAWLIAGRMPRIELSWPVTEGPETWLIVGLDDRAAADERIIEYTGPAESQPGVRADVIILVTRTDRGLVAQSVPRNLMVGAPSRIDPGRQTRLGVYWRRSPQQFVDVICTDLAVPVDHLITIDLQAFVDIVDALGGITVDVPQPLRDAELRFELMAGPQHMDGLLALGYVRSRLGEVQVGGRWIPEPDGEQARNRRQGQVLELVMAQLRGHPLALQRAAWRASPHIGLDRGTQPWQLGVLAGMPAPQPLLTNPNTTGVDVRYIGDQTRAGLAALGYSAQCSPA